MNKKITYKDAGVDIKKADEAIEMSKKEISSTFSKDVLSSIGGFGSMYSLKNIFNNFQDPVLVQSIDGVGTKMSVAMAANNFRFIGHDLVNACCNDVAATGAVPLTFLDYVAGSDLNKNIISEVIKSVAHEGKAHGVSLVGGETAEMPGTYHKNEYDLVGVATGIVEKRNIILKVSSGDSYNYQLELRNKGLIIKALDNSSVSFIESNKGLVIQSAISEVKSVVGFMKSQLKTIIIDIKERF